MQHTREVIKWREKRREKKANVREKHTHTHTHTTHSSNNARLKCSTKLPNPRAVHRSKVNENHYDERSDPCEEERGHDDEHHDRDSDQRSHNQHTSFTICIRMRRR